MISIGNMIKRISGLTPFDVTKWENEFISSVVDKTDAGADTTRLSPKQIEIVERIYNKHFAG